MDLEGPRGSGEVIQVIAAPALLEFQVLKATLKGATTTLETAKNPNGSGRHAVAGDQGRSRDDHAGERGRNSLSTDSVALVRVGTTPKSR